MDRVGGGAAAAAATAKPRRRRRREVEVEEEMEERCGGPSSISCKGRAMPETMIS
jgi:hypothetical protein